MPSAVAHEKLAARACRIRRLRRRIAAAVLATFVLAWGVVAFDGSMRAEATSVASTPTTTTTSTDASTASGADESSSSEDSAATMTTSQS